MIRGLNLLLFVTAIGMLIGVYALKYSSQTLADEKAELQREVGQMEATISLLEADWAYLSQPSHVAPIVERHAEALSLERVKAEQFGAVTDIPMRPNVVNDQQLTDLLSALDAGIDPIGDKLSELLAE